MIDRFRWRVERKGRTGLHYRGLEALESRLLLTSLALDISPNTVSENDSVFLLTATIDRGADTAGDLVVDLFNSAPNELFVPKSVTIPDGLNSLTFEIEIVNDGVVDGAQTATITATTTGHPSASDSVIVNDEDAPGSLEIGGHLAGNLPADTYVVLRTVSVDSGNTLTINPGSNLLFEPLTGINVFGGLTAIGEPSAPILFTSNNAAGVIDWNGIVLFAAPGQASQIQWAEISFASVGVDMVGAMQATVRNSDIHNNEQGVRTTSMPSQMVMEGVNGVEIAFNRIHDNAFSGVVVQSMSSVTDPSSNQASVTANNIFNNAEGVRIEAFNDKDNPGAPVQSVAAPRVSLNLIYDNEVGISNRALMASNDMVISPIIANNLLTGNTGGAMMLFADDAEFLAPFIINNTIASNGPGIQHSNPDPGFTLRNNILANNASGISAENMHNPIANSVDHNLLFNNGGKDFVNYPPNFGMVSTTNVNGTPSDFAFNIFENPQFVSVDNYHVRLTSPVANAGSDNGAPSADIDGDARTSFADIGFDEAINHPPKAVGEETSVAEDSTNNAIDVLANDSIEPDFNETLTVTAVSDPANGSASFTSAGVSYTPDSDFFGNDSFTYTISDGNGGTSTATVAVTVSAINDAPTAMDDALSSIAEDSGARVIPFATLTGNDSKGPGNEAVQSLTITAVSNPVGGTVVINGTNVEFTPTPHFNGAASFDYTVQDDGTTNGLNDFMTDSGSATFTVTEVNDPPIAMDNVLFAVTEDSGSRTIPFATLSGNDDKGSPNEAGQTLTITAVSNPVGGTVSIVGSDVIFTPTADFNGAASFDYTVQDNGTTNGVNDFLTDIGSMFFTVTEVNDAPTAADDVLATVAEDSGAHVIPFATLTGNDAKGPTNEAGQSLTITAVSNPVGGTVSIVGSDVVFTLTANFNGTASFDYTLRDNGTTDGVNDFLTDTGSASFTVTDVPEPPLPPANVSATDGAFTDRIRVTWSAAAGAASYQVFRNTANDPATATMIASGVLVTSFDDFTAVVGTSYLFWVKAVNAGGESGFSNVDAGTLSRVIPPDSFEADDVIAQAKPIALNGRTQRHNIHVAGDTDWVQFTLQQASRVTLQTFGVRGGDTTLFLSQPNNAGVELESNDNDGAGNYSKIVRVLGPGTYFVRVESLNNATTILGYHLLVNARPV